MNITNNQANKTISKVQRVVWLIVALAILVAISFLTNYLLSLTATSGFTHPAPYLVGWVSFWVGASLMVKAPDIWEKKRIFELRGFGPNYWVWVGWSFTLCWLVYLLYITKILPDPAIKLGALLFLITEGFFSISFSFGVTLLILLVFDERERDTVTGFCPTLQKTELQNTDITQSVIERLKEVPYNFPDDAELISSSWDIDEQKFTLVMEWERKIESDPTQSSSNSEKDKSSERKTIVHEVQVWINAQGEIMETARKKTIGK